MIELDEAVRRLRASDLTLKDVRLRIDDRGAIELADAMHQNSILTKLSLWWGKIGNEGAKALADALCHNSVLSVLELKWNKIGAEGAAAMADALRSNSALTKLNLDDNEVGDEGAKAMADALCHNSVLSVLGLNLNKIGAEGAVAMADALCSNSALTELNLDYNKIGDEGAAAMAGALCHNSVLSVLRLDGNKIGAKGAAAMEDALRINSALTELNLDCNEVGDEGAKAMAVALCHNSVLSVLRLSGNSFGDKGAKALGISLFTNSTLIKLVLKKNNIGDEGAVVLIGALCTNSVLTELELFENDIGFCQTIGRFIDVNKISSSPQEAARKKLAVFRELFGPKSAQFCELDEYLHNQEAQPHPSNTHQKIQFRKLEHRNMEVQLRQDVKSFQENRLAEEGISFYISVDRSNVFDRSIASLDSYTDWSVGQLVWEADHIKQAAAGDGSALSGLLIALQWIIGKYLAGECSFQDVLPPPPDELSSALGSPGALKSLVDRKLDGENEPSILHVVCAAEANCALQVSRIVVEDLGAEFDDIKDSLGRCACTIALANNNPEMVAWARRVGTLLGRYKLDPGQPIHKSATCKVVLATEVAEDSTKQCQVVLKIVAERDHYERELGIRLVHEPGSGVDISPDRNRFQEAHALKLHRYHDEMDPESKEHVMCLVMPLADRSLDDIIRAEHVAGRELYLIKHFAVAAARALHHLHSDHRIVHADFKPRNIVRLGSGFNLIDFDSSVRIGDPVGTGKVSTGYCPPELAKVIFSHDEEDLEEELKKQRDDLRIDLGGMKSPRGRAVIEEELKSIEEKIAQLEKGGTDPPKAHPTLDVWAFGVVMYYMMTGACLFQTDVADNLVGADEERKLVQWEGLCEDHLRSVLAYCPGTTGTEILAAKDLLRKCLELDPKDRPQSMAEVLRMSFLDRSAKPPGKKNNIRYLFSDPLVYKDVDGKLCPIKRLNFKRERGLLVQCLKNVKKDIRLSFDAATVPRLQELADGRCGCLHFTGHGHPSYLLFEDGCGGAHFLGIDALRNLIPRRDAFQFVFVGACHSQAIGQAFLDAGVPHVLCCEHESLLMDDAAAEFTRSFYCELAKGSTVKEAFDAASGVVRVGHCGESESQKYMLLPSDKDHSISIFDADDIEDFDEENQIEAALPAPPADIEVHQHDIYKVVSEVLSDSGKVQFIYLVGENHTARRYLLSAACHYIKDRLSTASFVDKLVYAKPNAAGSEDLDAFILNSVYKQLIPAEGPPSETTDSPEKSICKALDGSKTLIVIDGVGDAGSLCGLLNSLCNVAGGVKVLLSAEKKPAFSCPAAETVLHVGDLG